MIITLQWKEGGVRILKEYVTDSKSSPSTELFPFSNWEYTYGFKPESEVWLPSISLIKDSNNE